MTLIASYITKFGAIQASDSNLTIDTGNSGFGQKIFPIAHLNSSLAYSGSYYIDGKSVDEWLAAFITNSVFIYGTISEFGTALAEALTREMREAEKNVVTILHIVGYSTFESLSYVEHWHISNTRIAEDGSYSALNSAFSLTNDFNSYSNPAHRRLLSELDEDETRRVWYINGFPPGRICANIISKNLNNALGIIWTNPVWKFHAPQNLFEFSNVVKLYFEFVHRLFLMSDYNALYIGGEIQTHLIPAPPNLHKVE